MFGEVAVEMASIEEEAEFNLFKHPEVFLYKVPPQVSAAGHKCVRARGVRAGVHAWRLAHVPMCPRACVRACVRVRARRRAKDWGAEVGLAKMEVTAKGKVATIKLTDGKCARLCRLGFGVCAHGGPRVVWPCPPVWRAFAVLRHTYPQENSRGVRRHSWRDARGVHDAARRAPCCPEGCVPVWWWCVCARRRALNGAPNARARAPQ